MSLMNCPECGHEVSNEAVACPNCGRPFGVQPTPVVHPRVVVTEPATSDFPKWIIIPVVVVGAILVFLAFALMRDNEDETVRKVNVNVAVPQKSSDLRETNTRISSPPNQVEVPSSSTTITVPPATSAPVTVPPSSQTQTINVPSDKGLVYVDAKISTANGSVQSVKNEKFYLLDEDLETILSDADLEPIEGQSLKNSFGLAVLYPARYGDFQRNALNAIKKHIKYNATTDGSGKASMKDVKPDSYYLFGITKSRNGFALWSSPVNIIEGENKLNLSPATLTEISE